MKKYIIAIIMANVSLLSGCSSLAEMEDQYQHDADIARLDHLLYWSALIEEYYTSTGYYPFQNRINNTENITLVKIATKRQQRYLSAGNRQYDANLDINANGRFTEERMSEFVLEIQQKLGRNINEYYDIQNVPTSSPIGYNYFATKDGYLLWTTCITCGVTQISTLLMNGHTPTVNITSIGMKDKVTKALLRKELIDHPIFKKWITKKPYKAGYITHVTESNFDDSKI